MLALAWFTPGAVAVAENAARDGVIEFSSGAAQAGKISVAPGGELKLLAGSQWQVLAWDLVQEIQFAPESEELAQKWRFAEAGQTAKIKEGKPYPVRSLRATVKLAGNKSLTGHLYTTALYVEAAGKVQKIILPAKQRGQEGESLASLVYPTRLCFTATAATEGVLKFEFARVEKPVAVAALTHPALVRLEGQPTGHPHEYRCPAAVGTAAFVAAQTHDCLVVGWPKAVPESWTTLVRRNLAGVEDFFDDRQWLGTWFDASHNDVYALVLLHRQGQTTLAQERSQPWRLAVLRWKYDAASQRLLLAGQGYFFRGILARDQSLPKVELSEKVWDSIKRDP